MPGSSTVCCSRRRIMKMALGGLVATSTARPAAAADYPERPITLIVPFGPGGGVDTIARHFAQALDRVLGQSIVIENRSGAGSLVGIKAAMRAPADGYTLLLADPALVINALLADPAPYDFRTGLSPVSMVSRAPYILVKSQALEADNVQDIVALAKAREEGLSFASAGVGTAAHMTGELFRLKTQAPLMHVPYRGGSPAMADLVAGQVDLAFTTIASAKPYLEQGRAVGVATTGKQRSEEYPDLPTLNEIFGEFEVYFWTSLFAPGGTPASVIAVLEAAAREALDKPEIQTAFREGGNEAVPLPAKETSAFIEGEAVMWDDVIRKSGVKI